MQPLPSSLVSLRLCSSWVCQDAYPIPVRKSPNGLDLSHLTALTYLRLENLHSPDVLPTSLVELDVRKCVRLGPVQGLSRLQVRARACAYFNRVGTTEVGVGSRNGMPQGLHSAMTPRAKQVTSPTLPAGH